MIVALTGHRPEDCLQGEATVRRFARQTFEDVPEIKTVITGMAAGWDLWAADEARKMGLEVWAARPWAGHSPRKADEVLYWSLLKYATKVVNVNDSIEYPGAWCYQKRNEWMVDNGERVLAYWSGKEKGGTWNCIKYTRKVKKRIRNVYGDF